MSTLPRDHDAPDAQPVYAGLEFTYGGRKYEVEQILPGKRAICHSVYTNNSTILSFEAILSTKQ